MNCSKCGTPIMQGDQFCKGCGTPVTNQNVTNPTVPNPNVVNPNPIPNNQVNVSHPVNNVPPRPTPMRPVNMNNNSNNSIMIILGLIIVVLIGVVAFFVVRNMQDDSSDKNDNNNNDIQETASTIDVKYAGFTLPLSVDYIYAIEEEVLNILDEEETWQISLTVEDVSFSKVQSSPEAIKQFFESKGATSTMPTSKTYNGVEFVTTEVAYQGDNMLVAYSRGTATKIFEIYAANSDNTFDYDLLKNISNTLSKATYTGDSNSIEIKLDTSDFSEKFK